MWEISLLSFLKKFPQPPQTKESLSKSVMSQFPICDSSYLMSVHISIDYTCSQMEMYLVFDSYPATERTKRKLDKLTHLYFQPNGLPVVIKVFFVASQLYLFHTKS